MNKSVIVLTVFHKNLKKHKEEDLKDPLEFWFRL